MPQWPSSPADCAAGSWTAAPRGSAAPVSAYVHHAYDLLVGGGRSRVGRVTDDLQIGLQKRPDLLGHLVQDVPPLVGPAGTTSSESRTWGTWTSMTPFVVQSFRFLQPL